MKKITFKILKAQNFLSIGKELVIQFTSGINVITGENKDKNSDGNGVGKTTIIDSFYFAIFGNTLKDLKKENIVNNLAKKNCKVTLDFDIDNNGIITNYIIERGIAPSFCNLYINSNKDTTLSTIPATNNFILNLISSTQNVFRNTITMSMNNTIPFMAQKKNEKREFLEGILKLEVFKIMNKLAKENYDSLTRDYDTCIKLYSELENNINIYKDKSVMFEDNRITRITELNNRIIEYNQSIKDLETEIAIIDNITVESNKKELKIAIEDYKKYNTEYFTTSNKIASVTSNINTVSKDITNIKNQLLLIPEHEKYETPVYPISTIESYEANIIEVAQYKLNSENTIKTLEKENLNLERDIRDNFATIQNLEKKGSICDKCKRPFSNEDVTNNIKLIEDYKTKNVANQMQLKRNNGEIKEVIDTIEEWKNDLIMIEYHKQLIVLTEQLFKLVSEVDHYKKVINDNEILKNLAEEKQDKLKLLEIALSKTIDKNNFIKTTIFDKEKSIKTIKNDVDKIQNEKNSFEELIVNSNKKKVDLDKNIIDFKQKIKIYDVIKFVVSDEGVKSFIVKKLLNTLNQRINYYLTKMDANCTLQFDEYFEDKIINDSNIECSYENFSGGERKRIDLSCIFAFMDLRRLQGDVAFNLVFFDELIDSALSVNGSEKVFSVLKERFDTLGESCYIVTHKKENLKNTNITKIVYLEKIGGITKIKES